MGAQEAFLAEHAKHAKEPMGLSGEAIDGNVDEQNADFAFPRLFSSLGALGESRCACRKNRLGTNGTSSSVVMPAKAGIQRLALAQSLEITGFQLSLE